jgi:hypothetical protein
LTNKHLPLHPHPLLNPPQLIHPPCPPHSLPCSDPAIPFTEAPPRDFSHITSQKIPKKMQRLVLTARGGDKDNMSKSNIEVQETDVPVPKVHVFLHMFMTRVQPSYYCKTIRWWVSTHTHTHTL